MYYAALLAFLCCVLRARAQIVSTSFDASRFIGWYVGATTEPMLAANTWVTSGGFAGDCSGNGKCAMPTTCSGGTVFYDNGQTLKCTSVFSCVAMTIYASQPNVLPSARNYGCRAQWSANTLFRELAATPTPSSSSTPSPSATPSSAVSTTLAMSTSAVVSNPSSAPSSASTGAPLGQTASTSGSDSGSSKAWIAGAVIGPLVLLGALVAGLLFWRRRRNQKRDASQMPLTQEIGSSHQSYGQHQQHHTEKYAHNGPAEVMASPHSPYAELPTQHMPSELPATRY